MKKHVLFYLASPYTHKDKKVRRHRSKTATRAAIDLLKHRIHVFSPISYNSNADWNRTELPCEWPFWEVYDKNFLCRCDSVLVLMVEGWDKSVGIAAEIEFAKELNIPVFYKTQEQIEAGDINDLKEFENTYVA